MSNRSIAPSLLIRRQVVLEDHVPLPGGRAAVVVERRVAGEAYRSHLVLVPLGGGGRPRPLTSGAVRDTCPQAAPDGRRVAFLRSFPDQAGAKTRLVVIDTDGGEPITVWEAPRGVSEVAWAPDGRSIAVVAPADPPRFIVGRESPGRAPTARRITRADWRWDDVGHRDRWDHVWVLPAREGGRPRQVTRGDFDARGIAWSPDGRWIAFAADPRPDADIRPRPSIWLVPAAAAGEAAGAAGAAGEGAMVAGTSAGDGATAAGRTVRRGLRAVPVPGADHAREVLSLAGYAGSPSFSPSGHLLACVGVDVTEPLDTEQPGVFVAPFDLISGRVSGPARSLAPELDRPIGGWLDTDLNGWMVAARSGPSWDGDGALVALVSEAGRAVPWRFPVAADVALAAAPRRIVAADIAGWSIGVTRPAAPAGTPAVTLLGTLDDRPMELMVIDRSGTDAARVRTLTRSGSAWRRGIPWPVMQRILVPGPGGPIETWIASPAAAPDRPLPTVVDIHGGPLGAWSPAPSLEVVLLCSRGYRVVLPNIRGSAGYGAAWIAPQLGDWGGVDADDVLAAVDHAVALGLADPVRLGILGLSYGGFMVNWLVGAHPDRFAAAVSENGVTNQVSDWANSDSGPEYCRMARMGDVFSSDGIDRLWHQSPLRNVAAIRTPLLMLQAEEDLRCPPQDNEQLFIALRLLRRTVEFVLYPDSHHTYAVTGRPDRRIDRNERMLAWFDRYLRA